MFTSAFLEVHLVVVVLEDTVAVESRARVLSAAVPLALALLGAICIQQPFAVAIGDMLLVAHYLSL